MPKKVLHANGVLWLTQHSSYEAYVSLPYRLLAIAQTDRSQSLFMITVSLSHTRFVPCQLYYPSTFVFGVVSWHRSVLCWTLITVESTWTLTDNPLASYETFSSRGSNILLRPKLAIISLFRVIYACVNFAYKGLSISYFCALLNI